MTDAKQKLLTGVFFILMGVLILLAAFGIGPMSGSRMNAPRWVIGVCGLFFTSGGVIVIAPTHKIASLAAGIAVVGITVICAWIALFGDARYFSGGLSIFSRDAEVLIARVLFGAVAILGVAISVNAIRRALS
jgi:hypothetical protein